MVNNSLILLNQTRLQVIHQKNAFEREFSPGSTGLWTLSLLWDPGGGRTLKMPSGKEATLSREVDLIVGPEAEARPQGSAGVLGETAEPGNRRGRFRFRGSH